jgi:hypothetical protein
MSSETEKLFSMFEPEFERVSAAAKVNLSLINDRLGDFQHPCAALARPLL